MVSYARALRQNATKPERILWQRLRRRQLNGFKFCRQRPMGPYVCDLFCLGASLIVELDGGQHVIQTPYDTTRDAFLRGRGFRVLRFWNRDVLTRLDSVLDTIFGALRGAPLDGRLD
jgi:very-short-patch-repair endonuclease